MQVRSAPPLRRLSALALVVLLAACGSTPDEFDPKGTAEQLYADAREDMDAGNYERAIRTLERVEGRAAGTMLTQQALVDQAYAHWRGGDRVQALAALDRFLKLYPSSPAYDYALYLKGRVNFNDGLGLFSSFSNQDISERDQQASRDSYEAFRQLVDQFPGSKYAPDARARMDYIVNALAENELHVARYYFRRGAYVAAANRAQIAVRDYPQAPAGEEALYIMAQSYDRLGLTQLRDDADRVLKQNFPDSRYLKDGISRPATRWWQLW